MRLGRTCISAHWLYAYYDEDNEPPFDQYKFEIQQVQDELWVVIRDKRPVKYLVDMSSPTMEYLNDNGTWQPQDRPFWFQTFTEAEDMFCGGYLGLK